MENEHLNPSDGHPRFKAETHNRTLQDICIYFHHLHFTLHTQQTELKWQASFGLFVAVGFFLTTERRKLER